MASYHRVYDSRHLQADCQEPRSAPEPCARAVIVYGLPFLSIRTSWLMAGRWRRKAAWRASARNSCRNCRRAMSDGGQLVVVVLRRRSRRSAVMPSVPPSRRRHRRLPSPRRTGRTKTADSHIIRPRSIDCVMVRMVIHVVTVNSQSSGHLRYGP